MNVITTKNFILCPSFFVPNKLRKIIFRREFIDIVTTNNLMTSTFLPGAAVTPACGRSDTRSGFFVVRDFKIHLFQALAG